MNRFGAASPLMRVLFRVPSDQEDSARAGGRFQICPSLLAAAREHRKSGISKNRLVASCRGGLFP